MKTRQVYLDHDGNAIPIAGLDAAERRLLARLERRARAHADWCEFDNHWIPAVLGFYDRRGLSRLETIRMPLYQIGQDLSLRLGVSQGMIQAPTEIDQLEDLALNQYPSRRAFCKASGLSAKVLDEVLAGRRDLPLAVLRKALGRIGYRLRIVPGPIQTKRTG